MWQAILELGAQILLIFEDFKFWKKKRARRKFEKENGLPKKIMTYPSTYAYALALGILGVLIALLVFSMSWFVDDNKEEEKIAEIVALLELEKKYQGAYPPRLYDLIRNNPLRENIFLDSWGNAYYYELTYDERGYLLKSKGKDGVLNTDDDIGKPE